jgi:putative ABC transport system permease protein
MRTLLTILGLSIGIGAILFLVSLGYGLQRILIEKITNDDALLSLDVFPSKSGILKLDDSSIKKIKALDGVAEVSPVVTLASQISYGGLSGDTTLNAVEPSYFRLSAMETLIGDFFTKDDKKSVVISKAVARLFNIADNEIVGKKIKLSIIMPKGDDSNFVDVIDKGEFTVKGMIAEEDYSLTYLPYSEIESLKIKEYQQLKVKAVNNSKVEPLRNSIESMGFTIAALSDTVDQANKIFRAVQIVLAIFGTIALFVSAIGMFNTMTIALLERIQEIGIMRAIGASHRDISALFLMEATLMGFLGGCGGIVIGFLVGEIFNLGINILATNLGGQPVNLFYRPLWFVLTIVIFSTIVGFLTGVFPARKASKLNPLSALRYK